MISKVIVTLKPGYTDPSSVKRTKILAQQLKFDLLLYSAVHEDQVSRSQYGTDDALKHIETSMLKSELQRLQDIKGHFDGLCSSVDVQAQWQAPVAEGILSAAASFGADLIVLSGSERSKLSRLFMAHTDWEVIRRAKVPVLVSQNPEPKTYTNILAAVDPTHRNDQLGRLDNNILTLSECLRTCSDAELFLGHVYPARQSMSIETCMPPIDEFDSWQEFREAAMQKLAEKHHVDSHHTRLISGSPARGVADLAQSIQADLVVMGAQSRTFSSDRLLGSVAEKVLNELDCDLLFVPLEGNQ